MLRGSGTLLATLFTAAAAYSQDVVLSDLSGHSISIDYVEGLSNNGGPFVSYFWSDRIYVSTKGRLFHSTKQKSALRNSGYSHEAVSELVGPDPSQSGKLLWSEQGLVREWIRGRARIRYAILLSRTKSGFACRAVIERFSAGVESRTVRESCRVTRGNILSP
ncbi:MAG: hypothetical protein ACTHP8_07230 [Bosea sp. (in: a-proteobacteria)]|uniref:hypothetical protein n=1 Tax=Bosea sp. (in: a-proteobacteria) TaxID=1871050 RepID=UPI003F7CBD36